MCNVYSINVFGLTTAQKHIYIFGITSEATDEAKKMDLSTSVAFLLLALIPILAVVGQTCAPGTDDWTNFVKTGVGVESGKILEVKTLSLKACARACIQRKPCISFTYNTKTTNCVLSRNTLAQGSKIKGPQLIFAEFSWLPSRVRIRELYIVSCAM